MRAQKDGGERLTVEDIVRDFGKRPYGWPLMATLVHDRAPVPRWARSSSARPRLLDAKGALDALKNTRQHGIGHACACRSSSPRGSGRRSEGLPPRVLRPAKRGHRCPFGGPAHPGGAGGRGARPAVLLDQRGTYAFLGELEPVRRAHRGDRGEGLLLPPHASGRVLGRSS